MISTTIYVRLRPFLAHIRYDDYVLRGTEIE